jgi:hypothetical protein
MKKEKIGSVTIAYQILKREKRAMRPREIIDIAIDEFGLVMTGKTPGSTLNSNFINEIKRRKKSNREQRFVRVSRGEWGLVEYLSIHYEID